MSDTSPHTHYFANRCMRCPNQNPKHTIMSRFNLDILCQDCDSLERTHPLYPQAVDAELAAIKRGDYNYPGIGKPSDL